jgi:hypothetical protein
MATLLPFSFFSLKVGMWGTLNGTRYEILGRVRWSSKYKEYYKSDSGEGYSTEYWQYDEWILRDTTDKLLYLCEDSEGFTIAEEIDPPVKPTLTPDISKFTTFYEGKHRIIEYGTAEAKVGEGYGERVQGQQKYFFQYKTSEAFFNLEVPLNEQQSFQNERREYYKEVKISRREVLAAFKESPEIGKAFEKLSNLRLATQLAGWCTLFTLLMFSMSFCSQKTLLEHKIPFAVLSDSSAYTTPVWEIPAVNELYSLEIEFKYLAIPVGSTLNEVFVTVDIYDESAGVVNNLSGDFYHETGRDSDGPWTETNTFASQYARSESKGKFFANVYAESQTNAYTSAYSSPRIEGEVIFSVRKYRFLWYYTLPFFLLAFTIWIILAIWASKWGG